MREVSLALTSSCFSPDYATARAKFQMAAAQAGAVLHVYLNDDVAAPNGGSLTTDVAIIGPPESTRALIVVSGTHGPECFIGSAAQIAFMQALGAHAQALDVRVVLIHAINPWGAAHVSRCTEGLVDLNRNFVDWTQPVPQNLEYEHLHPWIGPHELDVSAAEEAQRTINAWIDDKGMPAFTDASMRGQYTHPDGLSYGGKGPEWSHLTLKSIIEQHLSGAEKVALIDWHTGLGESGEPFFLCFNDRNSEAWNRACEWWGQANIENPAGFDGAARPQYTGLLFQGVSRFVAPAQLTGAVIEFGTVPLDKLQQALQADRRLHGGSVSDPIERQALLTQVTQAFSPDAVSWQQSALSHAVAIQQQALNGLIAWRD